MGTISGYFSRNDIRAERTKNGTYKSCWVGNHLWIMVPAEGSSLGIPFIGLAIVSRHGHQDWAVKDVDETMGPYQDSCPESYLDATPVPPAHIVGDRAHEWAQSFRRNCRAHIERKRKERQRKQCI